jgi:crossover junction endodeoxyribonuclease RusA
MGLEYDGVSILVYGIPQPKGSKTAFVRGNRAVLVDGRRGPAREAFTSWKEAVMHRAAEAMDGRSLYEGPLQCHIAFGLRRPPSTPKRITAPAKKPDLDKLARAVLDAMTSFVYHDDAQIVDLHVVKAFSETPGCTIYVRSLT